MKVIRVPNISVNEDEVKLIYWTKKVGEYVKNNETICSLESSKSVLEIETDSEGYLYYINEENSQLMVGWPLAIITEIEGEDPVKLFETLNDNTLKKENLGLSANEKRKYTKKAEILAKKFGINDREIESVENLITEEIIYKYIEANKVKTDSSLQLQKDYLLNDDIVDGIHPENRQERVLILGAGGGGTLVVDILSRVINQRPALILDNNPTTHGKALMGVKVLGDFSLIDELWANGEFDTVISTIVKDNQERQEIFDSITSKGIPFANIIDTTANIRLNVKMGKGNLIVSGCCLAPSVTIGNNNFLAAYTSIEHHSSIGSHCTFGPRFTASGEVKIGDRCKFGTGIFIEPWVKIGQNTTVASGAILTGNIPPDSLVKVENRIHINRKVNEKAK